MLFMAQYHIYIHFSQIIVDYQIYICLLRIVQFVTNEILIIIVSLSTYSITIVCKIEDKIAFIPVNSQKCKVKKENQGNGEECKSSTPVKRTDLCEYS